MVTPRLNPEEFRTMVALFAACQEGRVGYCFGKRIGGAEGDRTLDLRIANATLSQLSYRPTRDRDGAGKYRSRLEKARDSSIAFQFVQCIRIGRGITVKS